MDPSADNTSHGDPPQRQPNRSHRSRASDLRAELGAAKDGARAARQQAQRHAGTVARKVPIGPGPIRLSQAGQALPEVEWLWPGRIPLTGITFLDGDPGVGKSLLALDLAARITTARPMPDGTRADLLGEPRHIIYFTAEDNPTTTLTPRLCAAGGVPPRVVAIREVTQVQAATGQHSIVLPTFDDLRQFEPLIEQEDPALVVFDPFGAYLGPHRSPANEQQMRELMFMLQQVCRRHEVAILILRHLNKDGGANALYRGTGSIGLTAAVRSALLLAQSPDEPRHERILATSKTNLAEEPPALRLRVTNGKAAATAAPASPGAALTDPSLARAPRLEWLGPCDYTADSLLARAAPIGQRTALQEAVTFLEEVLRDGPRPAADVLREARSAAIGPSALHRARQALGVSTRHHGYGPGSQWLWQLPTSPTTPSASSTG